MAKTRWLDRRIAHPGPYLSLVLSQKELDKSIKSFGVGSVVFPCNGAKVYILDNDKGERCCVVSLSIPAQSMKLVEIAGLLVHEAVHVWQEYVILLGEHSPGTEQEAYGIQSISQELLAEYLRRTKNANR